MSASRREPSHRRMPFGAAGSLVLVLALAVSGPAAGGEDPPDESAPSDGTSEATVPDDATLEANHARIGNVEIRIGNIFDPDQPGENRAAYRIANRLHRRTRRRVVSDLLLFRSGDPYSRRVLDESERILRSRAYLYDASIRPVRYDGEAVDVEVVTRDVWTLKVGVGFGRAGGASSTHFGIEDENFLGTGTRMSVRRTSNVDRDSVLYRYVDENLGGHRVDLGLWHASNSDGRSDRFELARPFFSLDARWAAGLGGISEDREDALYAAGHVTGRFRHRRDFLEIYGGLSEGLVGNHAVRWRYGFTFERDRFDPPAVPIGGGVVPEDRSLAYPWVEIARREDAFVEETNLEQIQRTEDLNLGKEGRIRLGWLGPGFGSDRSGMVLDAETSIGLNPGDAQILRIGLYAGGRLVRGGAENALAGGEVRYFRRDPRGNVFTASLRADLAHRLDPERQLLLGGDSGLRGYPLRFQDGDRRVLATVEERFFTNWHPWRLFHVGAAVFFDAGKAWFAGRTAEETKLLRDVGLGLRLGSSRSADAHMVHVDLAFPLDKDPSIRGVQFLVTTRQTF